MRDIDRLVGRLLAEIAAGGLGLEVNVVLTSDHGMAEPRRAGSHPLAGQWSGPQSATFPEFSFFFLSQMVLF